MDPIRVGLVGAGPWAEKAYAPMLAVGPETRLACVWARRPEAARELAGRHGAEAVESFAVLLERCEAVAFAVPPDVQAELAVAAARAGKHLMLDKPLAIELEPARRLVEAVEAAGVVSQLMLTHRYRPKVQAFLARARDFDAIGARLAFLTGSFVRGPYATPWRKQHGAFHDLGPHAFDLLEAALGPIERMAGAGDPRGWVSLACVHANGAVSDVAMSGVMQLPQSVFELELYGRQGAIELDAVAAASDEPWSAARRSFADAVRENRPPELDARHGLRLQELIDRALRAIG
jgi:predicted dehydrogenase